MAPFLARVFLLFCDGAFGTQDNVYVSGLAEALSNGFLGSGTHPKLDFALPALGKFFQSQFRPGRAHRTNIPFKGLAFSTPDRSGIDAPSLYRSVPSMGASSDTGVVHTCLGGTALSWQAFRLQVIRSGSVAVGLMERCGHSETAVGIRPRLELTTDIRR
ncbi:hypothetical protein F4780DRAFT_476964 [Xylariomycetidae sp. FL0641]|nr:hypothetical protein F4780DRAFT_476964 [Xylariomycetidae sp. FL0641]